MLVFLASAVILPVSRLFTGKMKKEFKALKELESMKSLLAGYLSVYLSS